MLYGIFQKNMKPETSDLLKAFRKINLAHIIYYDAKHVPVPLF